MRVRVKEREVREREIKEEKEDTAFPR